MDTMGNSVCSSWVTHSPQIHYRTPKWANTVLAEVLSLGWDKGSLGCMGWGTEEISFYKHCCDRSWETGRLGMGGKGNNQFPHWSPLASMNTEKLRRVRSKEGLLFLEKVKMLSWWMNGNERQRIKEVSTAQVLVWGRRQQKFGKDVVMLCREVGRGEKQFPCFLCWFKKSLVTSL